MRKDDKNLMVLIGKNVRRYRLRMGLSQEKLAELADFHSTYIGMIERAERKISIVAATYRLIDFCDIQSLSAASAIV